jgi:hypothetical protein
VLGGAIGFTGVPSARTDQQILGSLLFVPVVGAEYVHRFHPKWGLNGNAEVELAHYVAEASHDAGAGYEIEKHQNLFVVRAGAAYEVPMRDGIAVAFPVNVNYKEEFWTFSVAMALLWSPGG